MRSITRCSALVISAVLLVGCTTSKQVVLPLDAPGEMPLDAYNDAINAMQDKLLFEVAGIESLLLSSKEDGTWLTVTHDGTQHEKFVEGRVIQVMQDAGVPSRSIPVWVPAWQKAEK